MTMNIILNNLFDEGTLSKTELKYCEDVLNEALQSENKAYESYFSSRPIPGSIVEELSLIHI